MKHLPVTQGTPDWLKARLGIVTASEIDRIITPKTLKPSAQAEKYLHQKLAEWMTGQIVEVETRFYAMDRGIELEEEAADYFTLTTGLTTELCGFCVHDDDSMGCSPDRFVSDGTILELKAPLASTHVGFLLAGDLPIEHMLQVQAQLYVTECSHSWFLSYYPSLPPLLLKIEPDRQIHDALANALAVFNLRLAEGKKILQALKGEG